MVYLDYSATTKTNKEVLDSFVKCSEKFVGNPNSLHKLGIESRHMIDTATEQIKQLLNLKDKEVIYTSGSTESNNLAIKGVCNKYKNRGSHIITTMLEHSSVYGPLNQLKKDGFIIDYVKLDRNGLVDLSDLERLINDDTILVSICLVNSETGLLQPIDSIASIVHKYKKCLLHSDMTQAIGKIKVNINDIDLATFSAHKFYGIKGVGVLIKNKKLDLEPEISGGKSTTIYRSGTPSLPLIVSLSKALRLASLDIDKKYEYVKKINEYLVSNLQKYEKVKINSNSYCIPHILNISVIGVKPETILHALEEFDIYISTKSACSSNNSRSDAVYALTKSDDLAKYSIRISLSNLTTKEELDYFIDRFSICYDKLTNLR